MPTEFVFDNAPFDTCHAATIAATKQGLVAAWFGGEEEGSPDVGIWTSRRDSKGWSRVTQVATGLLSDAGRCPCWNPVPFAASQELLLFYKVGDSPSNWWGMLMRSTDDGVTWSRAAIAGRHFGAGQEQAYRFEQWAARRRVQNEAAGRYTWK